MAINFPDSPVLNQVFTSAGRRWRWDGTTWISLFDKGNVDISDTPPLNPSLGDLWYDSSTGICFVYYYDGNSYQWADIGSGGNTTLNPLSAINSPTVNLSHNTTTRVLSADVSSIGSFFTGATNQSLTTNGYQRLPGGLIIQWGDFPTTAGNQISVSRTFAITFPTAVLAFSCVANTNNRSGNALNVWSIYNYTTSGFTGRTQDNDSTPYEGWWIALGY